jgi:hypothetical protein
MNVIPAETGVFLIDRNGDMRAPIIGWIHVTGVRADPMFPVGCRPNFTSDEAILFSDSSTGFVAHPATGRLYATVADWVAAIAEAEEVKPEAQPDLRPIVFGNKTRKTKTFWHWPIGNAVFIIEGESKLPEDPRVLNVKRDEFAEIKKAGAEEIDPHNGVILPDPPPTAETEDDEDEFKNLV